MHNGNVWTNLGLTVTISAGILFGQAAPPEPKNWTAEQDHQDMMDQLGVKREPSSKS